jgi:hypothetical protein
VRTPAPPLFGPWPWWAWAAFGLCGAQCIRMPVSAKPPHPPVTAPSPSEIVVMGTSTNGGLEYLVSTTSGALLLVGSDGQLHWRTWGK